MGKYILAIDQGTTGSSVSIMNSKGKIVAFTKQEFEQIYPKAGWVEHNPEKIWESVLISIKKVFKKSKVKPSEIISIGITNQRETCLVWDKKTGKPIYNAIVWQCRRTTDECNKLKIKKLEKTIQKKTGLLLDPYFSATKLNWILKNKGKKNKVKDYLAGNIDAYLIWKLTKGASHFTDVTNASRTSLMNLDTLDWDKELLKIFRVPRSVLPEIKNSDGLFGVTAKIPGLPDGIPIHGVIGDQQAALFGQTAFKSGEAKCTFGTGSFILMNSGNKKVISKQKLLTTVAWKLSGDKKATYALEGGAFICGAAVQWLRDEMGFIKSSHEVEKLANTVKDTLGVQFVPALAGLGAPHWEPEARGVITGLTRGVTKAHLARATLEAMALQNVDILTAMEKDLGKKLKNLRVDGGASANNLLLQMQSDFLGASIYRPKLIETTVAGAAFMAGIGVGLWKNKSELVKINNIEKQFKNKLSPSLRKKRLEHWSKAVKVTY